MPTLAHSSSATLLPKSHPLKRARNAAKIAKVLPVDNFTLARPPPRLAPRLRP
jgi:hypothetical protein